MPRPPSSSLTLHLAYPTLQACRIPHRVHRRSYGVHQARKGFPWARLSPCLSHAHWPFSTPPGSGGRVAEGTGLL